MQSSQHAQHAQQQAQMQGLQATQLDAPQQGVQPQPQLGLGVPQYAQQERTLLGALQHAQQPAMVQRTQQGVLPQGKAVEVGEAKLPTGLG